MCGIVGAVAQRDVADILLEGLRRLEYRGYDSAGIAVIDNKQKLQRVRTKGKVAELAAALKNSPLQGTTGIAHTRWATHGVPSEANAHPHISSNVIAVVHNGIIENYENLRTDLQERGYQFSSQTDTEIIVHGVHEQIATGKEFLKAVQTEVQQLHGAYALGLIHSTEPERIIAIRSGSPLVIGVGIGENFIASDILALTPVTQRFIFLEEGDVADIRRDSITIYDAQGQIVDRSIKTIDVGSDMGEKAGYRHFMLKEIFEQSAAISRTLESRLSQTKILDEIFGAQAKELLPQVEQVQIVACGTSFHAAMVARYWFEALAQVPCQVEIASEFRYRSAVVSANTLFISISQSGETADTLAALRLAKKSGYLASLAICNVAESSLVRESDICLMTRAGPEIGVASTKAFTTQLVALLMLTCVLGRYKNSAGLDEEDIIEQLKSLPSDINKVLTLDHKIKALAKRFADKQHMLFLGRGAHYPIALEGALKMKELSYIHAEAYPAGELKHGPLALVDKEMPIIAVAPNDELLEKLKSNLEEVLARGGELFVFVDETIGEQLGSAITTIAVPAVAGIISPIIYTIPLQMLAYYVAVLLGTDVDQPRNLAKSVTVE